MKFTPPEGVVTVSADAQERDVTVAVSDTGPGIPPDQVEGMFEPYRSIDTRGKGGAGLGLFITRGIVQRHGGRVWVESQVGKGTTFFFTLPRA